jgi:hypothetical protein
MSFAEELWARMREGQQLQALRRVIDETPQCDAETVTRNLGGEGRAPSRPFLFSSSRASLLWIAL